MPVLSHERLSGYPHSGGFDSRAIAERLATVLPGARILIVVREQRSMIHSNYHQYVRDGGACPLHRYLQPPQPSMRRMPGFAAEFFAYDRLVETYRSHFGDGERLRPGLRAVRGHSGPIPRAHRGRWRNWVATLGGWKRPPERS